MWTWILDPPTLEAAATAIACFIAGAVYLGDRRYRRQEQASLVAAWLRQSRTDDGSILFVKNGSNQAIYRVLIVSTVETTQPLIFDVIPPGELMRIPAAQSLHPKQSQVFSDGVEVRFTDGAGRHWRRRPPHHQLKRLCSRRNEDTGDLARVKQTNLTVASL